MTAAPRLRGLLPGDLGWVIGAHGRLYAAEYGWDIRFEAFVAGVARDFLAGFEPTRHAAWIAELEGTQAGSVFVVPGPDRATAKLRMLIVEPRARGRGIGRMLVAAAEAFAAGAGHARMELWTHAVLANARRLYGGLGYRLAHSAPHPGFGVPLVEERWERALAAPQG